VAVLGAAQATRLVFTRENPDAHDWLEVTPLTPLEPEPVDELVVPELVEPELVEPVEPVELEELAVPDESPELVDPVEVAVGVVVVAVVATCVSVLRASAGSCPVTSTTVMSIHIAKNSATEPPITRARILRTRARRASLSLIPSSLVMAWRIGPRHRKRV
jgi:hypothetical protein